MSEPKPFKVPPQLPIAFSHTPEDLIQLTKDAIEVSHKILGNIAATAPAQVTVENTLLPFVQDDNSRVKVSCITKYYMYVSPSKGLRDASIEAHNIWSANEVEVASRKDLYRVLTPLYERIDEMDPEWQHFLRRKYIASIKNGLKLLNAEKKVFKSLKARIIELAANCRRNLRNEDEGIWITPSELDELPQEFFSQLKVGEPGTENEGKYRMNFKASNLTTCLAYVKDSNTRKRVFVGKENKCEANAVLFKELVKSRAEAAKMLGFKSHVDEKLQGRMMSETSVGTLLKNLRIQIAPEGARELENLRRIKRADLESRGFQPEDIDDRIFLWDEGYYLRLMKEEHEKLDMAKLSEYFSLWSTVDGLMRIFETLLGIEFVKITPDYRATLMLAQGQPPETLTWQEDVVVFAVWDEPELGGGFLGISTWTSSPEREKRTIHAIAPLHHRHYPSTALLTSFQKPTVTKPTLLRHRNVVSIFHKMGHGLHYLVGHGKSAETYGTHVAHDFIEVPSKMLENWCWEPSVLESLSHHYAYLTPEYMTSWKNDNPGEAEPLLKAPLQLVTSLAATRNLDLATMTQRQLYNAKFDIVIHSAKNGEDADAMNLSAFYNRTRKEGSGVCGPEVEGEGDDWGHGQARFLHLFDHSASYYAYAVASIFSRDMYETRFRHDPMNKEEGRRYRELVIGKGASVPEMSLLKGFLGRLPNGEAFSKALRK